MGFGSYLRGIATNTKDSMYKAKSRAMAFSLGMQATSTRGTTFKMKEKAMVKCIGLMVATIKVIGIRAPRKEKVELF